MLTTAIGKVTSREDLSMAEMAEVIDLVMSGQCEDDQIASLLLKLREKGETAEEVAGAARAMRKHMTTITSDRQDLVDTCGTGGDGSGTFNISTAAAIVAAATGISVAKHGNRKITSKTGSADVLVELGVNIEAPVAVMEQALNEAGICFMFAPLFHPSMRHVMPVRRSLGVPTIFNMLGPLCNPANASYQLLGVGRPALRPMLSSALSLLEIKRAHIVCGSDGLDEITLTGVTNVSTVDGNTVSETSWTPEDFGITSGALEGMDAEDAIQSAEQIRKVLSGVAGPSRDIVVLNAAGAISLARPEQSLPDCAVAAAEAIDSGAASDCLNQFVTITQQG